MSTEGTGRGTKERMKRKSWAKFSGFLCRVQESKSNTGGRLTGSLVGAPALSPRRCSIFEGEKRRERERERERERGEKRYPNIVFFQGERATEMGGDSCGFRTKDRLTDRFIGARQPSQSFVVGQLKHRTTTTAADCRAAFICLTDDSILYHGEEELHQPSCSFQQGCGGSSSVGTASPRRLQLACLTGENGRRVILQ